MKRNVGFLIVGVMLVTAGYALAQTISVPQVTNVGPTDLFQDIVNGAPTSGNVYATAAQINANQGYHDLGTVTTDPAYTVTGAIVNIFGHATGTVTAVTITTPPAPADGRRLCYWMDQTTTTLTWTANAALPTQTIDGGVHAAGVQYNSNCITFNAATRVWKSSN